MAGGGHADDPAIHIARPAADYGDDRPAIHDDPRLEHHGAERLQRLHRHHRLDRRVPYDKSDGAEIQARIKKQKKGKKRQKARLRRSLSLVVVTTRESRFIGVLENALHRDVPRKKR